MGQRLIDAEVLKEALENADPDVCESYPDGYSEWGFGRENVLDVINSIPTVDAVPVVRCRECKYRKDHLYCRKWEQPRIMCNTDFCSYGEREGTPHE